MVPTTQEGEGDEQEGREEEEGTTVGTEAL